MKAKIRFAENINKNTLIFRVRSGNKVYRMDWKMYPKSFSTTFFLDEICFVDQKGNVLLESKVTSMLEKCEVCTAEISYGVCKGRSLEIKEIYFITHDGKEIHLDESQLLDFQYIETPFFGKITKRQYNQIADFVHIQDSVESFKAAINNTFVSEEDNIKAYFELALQKEEKRKEIAEKWKLTEDLDLVISDEGGAAWYDIYSDDIYQRILLMNSVADACDTKIRKSMIGEDFIKEGEVVLVDKNGDNCDLSFATSMQFCEDYSFQDNACQI